ncbi:MAG: sterol desaturase family protein [Alphaproteobacteria bacterium]
MEWLESALADKTVLVTLWFAAFMVAERLHPAVDQPARAMWPRWLNNGVLWVTTAAVSFGLLLPMTLWVAEQPLWVRPDGWSGWQGLALDLMLYDALIYWWHRANHVVPFLWRFHQVHHFDETLDTSSAFRFHFGEVALSAAVRLAVIVALALPFASIVAAETMVLAAAIFHHSNLRLPRWLERPLSWAVVTPAIHWVHHHRVRADTDSNYATVLSLWDRLFGSRSPNPRRLDMPIGIEGQRETRLDRLLLLPFRPPPASRVTDG